MINMAGTKRKVTICPPGTALIASPCCQLQTQSAVQDQEDVADAAAEQPAEKKLKDSQADAAAEAEDGKQVAEVEQEPAADMEAAAPADTEPEPAAAVKEKGKDANAEAAEGAVKEQLKGPTDGDAGQRSLALNSHCCYEAVAAVLEGLQPCV